MHKHSLAESKKDFHLQQSLFVFNIVSFKETQPWIYCAAQDW